MGTNQKWSQVMVCQGQGNPNTPKCASWYIWKVHQFVKGMVHLHFNPSPHPTPPTCVRAGLIQDTDHPLALPLRPHLYGGAPTNAAVLLLDLGGSPASYPWPKGTTGEEGEG